MSFTGEELEERLLDRAAELPPERWLTDNILRIGAAIHSHLYHEDPRPLNDTIVELEDALEWAWERYRNLYISEQEITAESVVGHRFLLTGLEYWQEALELLGQRRFHQAMDLLIEANKLLAIIDDIEGRQGD